MPTSLKHALRVLKLNMDDVAPIPIASEPIATAVNTGSLRGYEMGGFWANGADTAVLIVTTRSGAATGGGRSSIASA